MHTAALQANEDGAGTQVGDLFERPEGVGQVAFVRLFDDHPCGDVRVDVPLPREAEDALRRGFPVGGPWLATPYRFASRPMSAAWGRAATSCRRCFSAWLFCWRFLSFCCFFFPRRMAAFAFFPMSACSSMAHRTPAGSHARGRSRGEGHLTRRSGARPPAERAAMSRWWVRVAHPPVGHHSLVGPLIRWSGLAVATHGGCARCGRLRVQRKGAKAQRRKKTKRNGWPSLPQPIDDPMNALPHLLLAEVDDEREPQVGLKVRLSRRRPERRRETLAIWHRPP